MKKLFLISALLLASITPLFAVTTAKFAVTNAAWTDLGAGPMLVSFRGDGAFAVGDITPTIPVGEGFSILSGDSFKVDSTSHVWATSKTNSGVTAYVSAY
jgi:hypothetical protein